MYPHRLQVQVAVQAKQSDRLFPTMLQDQADCVGTVRSNRQGVIYRLTQLRHRRRLQ